MAFASRHPLIVWASLAVLTGNLGCAARLVAPPSEEVRTGLGTVGVATAQFMPRAEYWTPEETKKGAARGLSKGAKIGAKVGFWPGAFAGAAFGPGGSLVVGAATAVGSAIVGAPIGATLGAMKGATKDPPAEAVRKAEADLQDLLAVLKVQEGMRDHVVQLTRDQTQHPVLLMDHGPTTQEKKPTYRALATEGIDTVLELNVSRVELSGPWAVNPHGALVMTVRVRLIQVMDGTELSARDFQYNGGPGPFTDLADNPEPLREGLEVAYQTLAKEILDTLFLAGVPPGTAGG